MTCRYGRSAILGETLRASVGLVIMAVVMIAANSAFLIWTAITLFMLFAAYLASVGLKALTSLAAGEGGLTFSRAILLEAARTLRWPDIESIRLDFFPYGRDRAKGSFRLIAKGAGTRIVFDSSLDDFAKLVREIVRRTEGRVTLSPVSLHNLKAFEPNRNGALPA